MAERSFLKKDFPNIWDYLYAYGNTSFEELPFNVADNLVLACLAYIPWENFLKPNLDFTPISLKDALCAFLGWLRPDYLLYHDPDWSKKQLVVAAALVNSSRFSSSKRTAFGYELSQKDFTQFGAISLRLDEKTMAVCFRGTDNSFLGWKESLSLAIYPSLPGQVAAEKFLKKERQSFPDCRFYVLGHSKGGNLAVYASSMLSLDESKRIISIYSDDGPGLVRETYDLEGHRRIQPKIIHIVPQFDIVGTLLLHERITHIVKSYPKNDIINQHDICNWHLDPNCLYRLDTVSQLDTLSVVIAKSANELLDTVLRTPSDKKMLIDGILNTLEATGIKEPGQIIQSPTGFRRKFYFQYRKQKKEEKKIRHDSIFAFFRLIQKNLSLVSKKKGKDTDKKSLSLPKGSK